MEKDGFILLQTISNHSHDVLRSGEARFSVADYASKLHLFTVEPIVDEGELLATVINLLVVESLRLPCLQNGDVLPAPVSNFSEVLP